MDLQDKYRPKSLKTLVGQPEAAKVISAWINTNTVPHAILLTGYTGCGKTTCARILGKKVGAVGSDLVEINAASSRGIDTIRAIEESMKYRSLTGGSRMWIIDECHQLPKISQSALLKLLEDVPDHAYFALATTHPGSLLPTIKSRCSPVEFRALSPVDLSGLVKKVAGEEGVTLSEEACDRIVEVAAGSARQALVLLQKVMGLVNDDERLAALSVMTGETAAIEVAKALMNPKSQWKDVSKLLKSFEEDPEQTRFLILAYAKTCLLSKQSDRAWSIIQTFRTNLWDSGMAGFVANCYEVITGK